MRFYLFLIYSVFIISSCKEEQKTHLPSEKVINELNLKKGDLIFCGSGQQEFGKVRFNITGDKAVNERFTQGLLILHSFEYDEAEKVFAQIIDSNPGCAMAYWGVAMSNYHPLWAPPSQDELAKGAKALEIARSLNTKSQRESDYISALSVFFRNYQTETHASRSKAYEVAMENLYRKYTDDKEAAIFYALALNANADPTDKTFTNQKKAGSILINLYPNEPNHPGVVHYIIHTFDSPEFAAQGLEAAQRYASVAPSSAHALHMPSHIFTRLGLWEEAAASNFASMNAAKCYAESAGISGHWDEELHALDYLVYAYLQQGKKDSAKQLVDYLHTMTEVNPVNFKVAYAYAAVPSRYVLENRLWKEASNLPLYPENINWEKYPWQKAIYHFTRVLGAAHIQNIPAAKKDLKKLQNLYDTLVAKKENYQADQVDIQLKAAEAWIAFKEGKNEEALKLMQFAAEKEDLTAKHPVTPAEVLPAKELLGDMLFAMKRYKEAAEAYEQNLKKNPERLNGKSGLHIATSAIKSS